MERVPSKNAGMSFISTSRLNRMTVCEIAFGQRLDVFAAD